MKLLITIGPTNSLANDEQCSQLKDQNKLFKEQEWNFKFMDKNKKDGILGKALG
jgi:hypothetical protein